jgi:hypothetical protein
LTRSLLTLYASSGQFKRRKAPRKSAWRNPSEAEAPLDDGFLRLKLKTAGRGARVRRRVETHARGRTAQSSGSDFGKLPAAAQENVARRRDLSRRQLSACIK